MYIYIKAKSHNDPTCFDDDICFRVTDQPL